MAVGDVGRLGDQIRTDLTSEVAASTQLVESAETAETAERPPDPPASGDVEATSNARDRLAVETSIKATRTNVQWLDGELTRLETDNTRLYESSQATIQRMQTELAPVLTDRRVHEHTRVEAFFAIAKNSEQSQRLARAWADHRAKQSELGNTLGQLRETERSLSEPAPDTIDARLVLFQRRIRDLEALLANLEQQQQLLKQMVAQASGTGQALSALQQALDAQMHDTREWIARTRGEAAEDVLARLLDVAGFVSMLALPATAFAAMTPLIGLLRDLVRDQQPIENFVWNTLGSLATRALVEAGVSGAIAGAIVGAIRGGAQAAGASRDDVAAAIAGAALTGAQSMVINFLAHDASDALPLAALARSVVALKELSDDEARKIVASLSSSGRGVDAALSMLEAAAR